MGYEVLADPHRSPWNLMLTRLQFEVEYSVLALLELLGTALHVDQCRVHGPAAPTVARAQSLQGVANEWKQNFLKIFKIVAVICTALPRGAAKNLEERPQNTALAGINNNCAVSTEQ